MARKTSRVVPASPAVEAVRVSLLDALRAEGTPERAAQEKRYHKSTWEHWGVPAPRMDAAIRAAQQQQTNDRKISGRGDRAGQGQTALHVPPEKLNKHVKQIRSGEVDRYTAPNSDQQAKNLFRSYRRFPFSGGAVGHLSPTAERAQTDARLFPKRRRAASRDAAPGKLSSKTFTLRTWRPRPAPNPCPWRRRRGRRIRSRPARRCRPCGSRPS